MGFSNDLSPSGSNLISNGIIAPSTSSRDCRRLHFMFNTHDSGGIDFQPLEEQLQERALRLERKNSEEAPSRVRSLCRQPQPFGSLRVRDAQPKDVTDDLPRRGNGTKNQFETLVCSIHIAVRRFASIERAERPTAPVIGPATMLVASHQGTARGASRKPPEQRRAGRPNNGFVLRASTCWTRSKTSGSIKRGCAPG